jgi:hypothetical protein
MKVTGEFHAGVRAEDEGGGGDSEELAEAYVGPGSARAVHVTHPELFDTPSWLEPKKVRRGV